MATFVSSLSTRPSHQRASQSRLTHLRFDDRIRNALQSLSNCAYLLACDSGVSPNNVPLLSQMQADVATVAVLLRRREEQPKTKEPAAGKGEL